MIDEERLRRYLRRMRALQGRVGNVQFVSIFRAKLQDLLARGLISRQDLSGMEYTLNRLFGDAFTGFEQRLFRSYDNVTEILNEEYDDLAQDVSREFYEMRAVERVARLQLGEYKQSTVDAIVRKVREGLKDGLSVDELTRELSSIDQKAERYARTLAFTQIKRYGRAGKYQKALLAGVEYFQYGGVLRETTRRFCRICLHKIFHINTIFRMRNGNLEPVILNCGGWNCIHNWEPAPTATAEDAASGEMFTFNSGDKTIKIFGPEGTDKVFRFSEGFERITQGGLEAYIRKARKAAIKAKTLRKIERKHYSGLDEDEIVKKINRIRNNPDNRYYQHNNGPRIVFEKDGEFVFASAGKVRTVFRPEPYDQFFGGLIQYLINLNDML